RLRTSYYDLFRLDIRDLLSRRIFRDVRDERTGRDALPRRLARAVRLSAIHSVVDLVLRESRGAAFRVHLDSRNAASHARRSRDELRLEIHAADGLRLHSRG